MFKLSVKKLLFLLPVLAILAGIIFWQNIFIFSLGLYLEKYCHDKLAGSFKSERIYADQDAWVIEKPEIAGHNPLPQGGLSLKADSMRVRIIPHIWNRQIDLDIAVNNPNLNIKQTATDVRAILNDLFPPAGYVTVNTKISVKEGSIAFHDFKQDPPHRQTLYFQLDAECGPENKGCLIVSLDDPALKNNCVVLSLAQMEKREVALDFNFDGVKCASLLSAARNIMPELQEVTAEEGLIKGQMSLTIPENGRPYAVGSLVLQDLDFAMPSFGLKGSVKEAHLHLSENRDPRLKSTVEAQNSSIPKTVGHLELTKEIALKFERDGQPYCEITDLIGAIYFQTQDSARVNMDGRCAHHGKTSNLHIAGDARLGSKSDGGDLDISLRLSSPGRQDTSARFVTRSLESKFKYAEIGLKNIGPAEFDLFKMLFTPYFPDMRHVHMIAGTMDASVLAYMRGFRMTDLKIEKIAARGLHFNLKPWELIVKVGDLSGDLSANLLAENIMETLNADLLIADGQVCFAGVDPDVCQLSDVHTRLAVRKGIIEKSIVKGMFAGLNGTIDLDGQSPNGEMMKLNFRGGALGLASLAPETIRERLKKNSASDILNIIAGVRSTASGLRVEGTLNIKGDKDRHGHTIEYGFDLERASQQLWGKWPPHHLANSYWHNVGLEATLASMPSVASPTAYLKTMWLKRELGIAGFVLRAGWFQAQNLPLDKFLEPIMFPEGSMKLAGQGDFQGTFDHKSATINYDLRNAAMENNDLSLEFKGLEAAADRDPMLPLPGTYYYDIDTGAYYGILPIANGSYFEKTSGLLFTEVNSLVIFEGQRVHWNDLSTVCNGMYFAGKIDADLSNPNKNHFDVDICTHTIRGSFSQLQHLFSHFDSLAYFQKFPLEGNLSLRDKGAGLHMAFRPSGLQLQSYVHGSLANGTASMQNADIFVKDLNANFDFDYSDHALSFSDIQGSLLIGKPDQAEEYVLAGDHINFTDLRSNEADFDFWIGDNTRDILRVVGQAASKPQENKGELVEILLDSELTHFGDVHPSTFELVLRNWTKVDHFKIELGLRLDTILYDLQLASRTGMFFLSPTLVSGLNNLRMANGELEIHLNYDDKTSTLAYHATGEGVSIGDYKFKKCSLHGKKNGDIWAIDQLLLDDVSVAADLVRQPAAWKANFLGVRVGESMLVGMEGEYRDGESVFDARVNLLEVNLEKLDEWPSMLAFVNSCNPKGFARATGTFKFELKKEASSGWRFDALLNSAFKSLEVKGLKFQDTINSSCHFVSDRGVTLRQIKTALKDDDGSQLLALLSIEKINYDFAKDELSFDGYHFNVPSENLLNVSKLLHRSFPDGITDRVAAIIGDLKHHGNLEGSLNMTRSPASSNFQIALKEGSYRFLNKEHEINNFVLKFDLRDLKILTQYRLNHNLFWLSLHSAGPRFDSGIMALSDHYPDQFHKSPPQPSLKIHWFNDERYGLIIHKAEGRFSGMNVHLHNDHELPSDDEALHLAGTVTLEVPKAANFISQYLGSTAESWQIGDGYHLNGRWRIGKNRSEDMASQIHFHGILEGQNVALKGYQFQGLYGQIDYVPRSIQFRQLTLEDPAGVLFIEQGDAYQAPAGDWILEIPMVTISDFRPSLLQEAGSSSVKQGKPLVVRHLEIENLIGNLADANYFVGKGKLQFVNPPKKNLQNTIFAIPAEILTMLGLDLTVLNPVSGTIFYEIKDGRVFLTKFKDIYSEGKLSKFHLTNSNTPSYVDFDGNLRIQIRMKQYNLFFKLAELFTVSVGGTLKKPTYSLQKQQPDKATAKNQETGARSQETGDRYKESGDTPSDAWLMAPDS